MASIGNEEEEIEVNPISIPITAPVEAPSAPERELEPATG